jgi:hypothetical protein
MDFIYFALPEDNDSSGIFVFNTPSVFVEIFTKMDDKIDH